MERRRIEDIETKVLRMGFRIWFDQNILLVKTEYLKYPPQFPHEGLVGFILGFYKILTQVEDDDNRVKSPCYFFW